MSFKMENPAPLAKATGLGSVHCQENVRVITLPLSEIQMNFVSRRMRLAPDRARVVAELMFDRRAA